jgi:Holliday junction DNA helicase RuvA
MITLVQGTLIAKELDRVEVLTTMGIAYECSIPASAYERLPAIGRDVRLHTAVVTREDGSEMYGFPDAFDRRVFLRLQSASGVGPRLALAMVGALLPMRLVQAIRERDVARLQTIPGVGKKKAERIVLELAERMDDLAAEAVAQAPGPAPEEAVRALVSLGYAPGDAERAVRRAALDRDGRPVETAQLVKAALAHLR